MTVRHIVTWKLAEPDAETRGEQAAELVRRLKALEGVVPELLGLSAGVNIAYPEANWDVSLVADFASLSDLEAYQVHPAHQEVGTYVRSIVESRVAVDFEA